MKVLILGSGVIGVTSAYYLAKAGHEVHVVDRQPGPALETSFANAGEISPGYASPWAAPGVPFKALKWMVSKHSPLILRPGLDPARLLWMAQMLRNCTGARYAVNKARMVRIAEYSRDKLIALRADTGLAYDERMQGTLQLFRTQAQMDGIAKDVAVLQADGVPFEVLDREGCTRAEPGLADVCGTFVGGLRLPNDETGDCFLFTNALAELAQRLGVHFDYGTAIDGIEVDADRVTGVRTSKGFMRADAYVVALGSYSPALLRPLGIRLPVYPVKGYSITVPIVDEARAPVSTILDETYKIAITRLGSRIRVGGMAEIAGFDRRLRPAQRETLQLSLGTLFPGVADMGAGTYWSGFRPMTPDGTPVIGKTRYGNLFLNTGHGTLGWTMACGSAQVVADIISARPTEIEAVDLAISRYAA
ncbi:D-amino-acid dehydrogenase [Sphingobium sp. B11D3B]|uniref:D-amino acid dehydrogenase n=1 Tax=Sphingobium sp. B11D3B TaxID=2940575 RepID=UPI0022266F09|nr:D-amino acid dehydrogenase [Sphingobium sp. B11D3B]MCW2387312.1 D-amino-acid dehydrogenase [Sphingobium sp. B11D3B]